MQCIYMTYNLHCIKTHWLSQLNMLVWLAGQAIYVGAYNPYNCFIQVDTQYLLYTEGNGYVTSAFCLHSVECGLFSQV